MPDRFAVPVSTQFLCYTKDAALCVVSVEFEFILGPNQCISLQILSVDINLLQIYQYWHILSPISAYIKTVFQSWKKKCLD